MKHKVASKNFLELSLLYVKKVGPHHFYNRKSGPRRKKFGHPWHIAFDNILRYVVDSNFSNPASILIKTSSSCVFFSLYSAYAQPTSSTIGKLCLPVRKILLVLDVISKARYEQSTGQAPVCHQSNHSSLNSGGLRSPK